MKGDGYCCWKMQKIIGSNKMKNVIKLIDSSPFNINYYEKISKRLN